MPPPLRIACALVATTLAIVIDDNDDGDDGDAVVSWAVSDVAAVRICVLLLEEGVLTRDNDAFFFFFFFVVRNRPGRDAEPTHGWCSSIPVSEDVSDCDVVDQDDESIVMLPPLLLLFDVPLNGKLSVVTVGGLTVDDDDVDDGGCVGVTAVVDVGDALVAVEVVVRVVVEVVVVVVGAVVVVVVIVVALVVVVGVVVVVFVVVVVDVGVVEGAVVVDGVVVGVIVVFVVVVVVVVVARVAGSVVALCTSSQSKPASLEPTTLRRCTASKFAPGTSVVTGKMRFQRCNS
jgi:hypothetical protein